jgi:hypothetical protein
MDMIDADFRWLERQVMQFNDIGAPTGYAIEKTLQWRKLIGVAGLNGEWTKWQDVRTEEQ